MTSKERSNFRQTKVWRGFRSICKQLCQGVDRLTGSKLSKTFNLHHMAWTLNTDSTTMPTSMVKS